jgi:hypothetical protein
MAIGHAASLLRARPDDWRLRPSAVPSWHVGVLVGRGRIRCAGRFIRFTHSIRENRNDHIVGEVWFDSIPFSKSTFEICLAASQARRPRAAAGLARIPSARRDEGIAGVRSPERR